MRGQKGNFRAAEKTGRAGCGTALWLAAACLLAGCAAGQRPSAHSPPGLPDLLVAQAEDEVLFRRHCSALPSPQTRVLLQRLARQNLQVRAAWARVRRAQAQAEQHAAGRRPSLRLSVQASRAGNGPLQSPGPPSDAAVAIAQYEASVAAEYEVDLWNRLAKAEEAAQWQVEAQRMNAQSIAVSLGAQLLESWFDLGFQLQQRELIETQADASRKLLDLLKLRFLQGAGPALDALQQKQQLQSLRTALAGNQAEIALRRNQLAVLLGNEPGAPPVHVPEALPALQPFEHTESFSATALAFRPDVRAAFHLVQAADAQLAAALAQRLPGVRLSGAIFNRSANLAHLADTLLWRMAAAVTQPLYAGGRIAAQIDEARAARDDQLLQFRQALLIALQELSDAWIAENLEAERIARLSQQEKIARNVYRLARQQYLRGAVDYLRVLNALQSMVDVQQQLLRARRQRISYRIQFCRALGIGWLAEATRAERQPP